MSEYKIDYALIAARVKAIRKEHNLTQDDFAKKIGISRNAVAKLETGRMTSSLSTLIAICNLFHLSLDFFLKEDFRNKELTTSDILLALDEIKRRISE